MEVLLRTVMLNCISLSNFCLPVASYPGRVGEERRPGQAVSLLPHGLGTRLVYLILPDATSCGKTFIVIVFVAAPGRNRRLFHCVI